MQNSGSKLRIQMTENRKPSWWVATIPFIVLTAALGCTVRVFGADALAGGSQLCLLLASSSVVLIAMCVYKIPWKKLEEGISNNVRSVASGMLVLLMIGCIAGSWMVSGIVPTLIYYGLQIITPRVFLVATSIICALVSVMTGSSWTTIATIGVALLGIGEAFGYSASWTAGAIISGAYFGDKISPLSDTTVLASSSAGTDLFSHIRFMLITTVPSFTIALAIFIIASITHDSSEAAHASEIADALKNSFHISGWLLAVPVITGILIAKKLPALITLFGSALMAGAAALIAQPEIIHSIAQGDAAAAFTATDIAQECIRNTGSQEAFSGLSFHDAFKGLMTAYYGDTAIETGNETLNGLVTTSGMNGMLPTIFLIICAVSFGGLLVGSGMIQSLTEMFTRKIKSRTGTVGATVGTGIFSNMVTGDQYLSIILCCSLFKNLYEKNGFEAKLLSRSAEDSATVTSVLIPWNSCGMTQSTILGVPTLSYLPYCFFNYLSPLMSVFIASIGYKIVRRKSAAS